MLNKKFTNKKDISKFKKDYSDLNFKTEVISNILQPYYKENYPEIEDYLTWQRHCFYNPDLYSLNMFLEIESLNILHAVFGKCDFSFDGNRTYKNYVFEFEGLTFITPSKREVVLLENKDISEYISKIVDFEKEFKQFLLTKTIELNLKIPDDIQASLERIKKDGIISHDNVYNFDYFKNNNILKKILNILK